MVRFGEILTEPKERNVSRQNLLWETH